MTMPDIPDRHMNPPMMAIGDSLYQGVRSLTIRAGTCKLSAPALVARGLGIDPFSSPDPPRPILVNMERWLRMLPRMSEIKADLAANARLWIGAPKSPSGRILFDNNSTASSTVADLYTDSPARAERDVISQLPDDFAERLGRLDIKNINWGRVVQAFNTRFTLNPGGLDAFREMTPVKQVAARKPKRLLVNIGSNNGLWELAFEANPNARVVWHEELRELGRRLSALPSDVEHIYFNTLGPASSVPNLMPTDNDLIDELPKPPPGGYYQEYENRFGFGYGTISGDEMRALDAHIEAENGMARQILTAAFDNPNRLHFVDTFGLLKEHNAKHIGDRAGIRLDNGKLLRNVMLEADAGPVAWIAGRFRMGGLMGLDGMHPTVPGYALMANRVLQTIAQHEPGVQYEELDVNDAFAWDTLLTDIPAVWALGLWLWRDIRRAKARGEDRDPLGPSDAAKERTLDAAVRIYAGQ